MAHGDGGTTTGGKTGGTTTATGGAARAVGPQLAGLPPWGGDRRCNRNWDAAIGGGMGSSDGKTPIKVWLAGDSTMADGASCSASGCPCGLRNSARSSVQQQRDRREQCGRRSDHSNLLYKSVSGTPDANGECAVTDSTLNSRWTKHA